MYSYIKYSKQSIKVADSIALSIPNAIPNTLSKFSQLPFSIFHIWLSLIAPTKVSASQPVFTFHLVQQRHSFLSEKLFSVSSVVHICVGAHVLVLHFICVPIGHNPLSGVVLRGEHVASLMIVPAAFSELVIVRISIILGRAKVHGTC